MELPLQYSKTPPAWLDAWPVEAAVKDLFAPKIREYAWRVLQQTPPTRLDWTADTLCMALGAQRPSWRLENGQWRRSCSCGYRDDRCVHLYLVARFFAEVQKKEGRQPGRAPAPVGAGPRPGRHPTPAAAPAPKPDMKLPLPAVGADSPNPLQLLRNSRASRLLPGGRPRNFPLPRQARQPRTGPRQIEVEVDFHHSPGDATLRFYLTVDGERQLLRIQRLLNLARQVANSDAAERDLSHEDGRFLNWLLPTINDPARWRENLQVLKITRQEFAVWLEVWAEVPARFIERDSQAPINRSHKTTTLHFELTDVGPQVEIAAIVTPPSGKPQRFHEVFQMLASGQRQLVLDKAMLDFEPPVSWDMLAEIFARKSPRMNRQHVPEYLPVLVEGRLDLVRGRSVRQRAVTAAPEIEVKPDGADLLIDPRIGKGRIWPGSRTVAGEIKAQNGGWLITTYTSPHLDSVRRFVESLPLTREKNAGLRLAGSPQNIQQFAAAWDRIPAEIERRVAPELFSLLGTPMQLVPELILQESRSFLDVGLTWAAGNVRMFDSDVREAVSKEQTILRTRSGGWLRLDLAALRSARERFAELGFGDGGTARLFPPEAGRLLKSLPQTGAPWQVHPASQPLAERLLTQPLPVLPALPDALHTVLRDYQKQGFEFLRDRCAYRVGAILADDMGLGKTVQVLSVLHAFVESWRAGQMRGEKQERGALVVCPASVVAVWLDEAKRFCPGLRCAAYAGTPAKRQDALDAGDWDVLVTNYALVRNDAEQLLAHTYDFVVLDEAQQIKNPDSQIAQITARLRTPRPLALTGTPLENRVLDLWSIMNFVNPGFLGDRDAFTTRYETAGQRGLLSRTIAPVLLRRLKEAVARELPARTEEVLRVEMGDAQRDFYERELLRARAMLQEKGPIEVLAALTRLRQVCCHPRLLIKKETPIGSAKLERLLELVNELMEEGHSLLIFSQFTSMLAIIEQELAATGGVPFSKITGDTPVAERARLVQEFNDAPEARVFLLSLKAAGTGLTLTKADYVVIFDPWWNPAVERQAIDRTHRIGQDKPVMAYRLVAAGTVEEKILALQQEKAELFAAVMADAEAGGVPARLTAEDFARLLS